MNRCARMFMVSLSIIIFSGVALAQYSSPVRDVENPSQNPFWSVAWAQNVHNQVNFFVMLDPVPAGKRLTLEFVSIICTTTPDDSIYDVRISAFRKSPMMSMQYPIHISKQGNDYNGNATWVASQPMRLYLDSISMGGGGPDKMFVNIFHKNYNDPDGSCTCVVDLAGSLVNAP